MPKTFSATQPDFHFQSTLIFFVFSVNTDKILCLSQTIADTNLQQLSLVPHSAGPLGVSTVDIIGLKSSLDRVSNFSFSFTLHLASSDEIAMTNVSSSSSPL